MIQIKPTLYVRGKEKATTISIDVKFNTQGETATTYYVVSNEVECLADGNIEIPSGVYNAWGADNSCIEDYVLTILKLELLNK